MNFTSDNWAGVHPAITENLARHASGMAAAYGTSDLDRRIERRFCEIFEREVAVFFVGTGTAANSLALASVNRPGGVVLCHREAHMVKDECGAPEYFTGGARLQTVDGAAGKMDPRNLIRELKHFRPDFIHAGQAMAVSLTQATEVGTIYQPHEIAALSDICRDRGLPLHMDGARFANALVSLGTSPAEMAWKQGVDIVSFGGTKNGCWCAEALVFFDPESAKDLPYIRKRAAQLFSKTRFIAAQFEAYLDNGLWLDLAAHANRMAARLADAIRGGANVRLAWEVQANEVFAIIPATTVEEWRAKGVRFHPWPVPGDLVEQVAENEIIARLVTSFATTEDEVSDFIKLLEKPLQ
ncbi:MAG: low specificity L-threonine aldolase [Luteolibacter sp.]|uniref:threonine aldolase family protein n=1 Tax=Luteolibacter sp. TaxID=1962973 RepID=UPI0032679D19